MKLQGSILDYGKEVSGWGPGITEWFAYFCAFILGTGCSGKGPVSPDVCFVLTNCH